MVTQVPTLTDCINQLGAGKTLSEANAAVPECLQPYMRYFTSFLKAIEQKRIKQLQRQNKKQPDATSMDF